MKINPFNHIAFVSSVTFGVINQRNFNAMRESEYGKNRRVSYLLPCHVKGAQS